MPVWAVPFSHIRVAIDQHGPETCLAAHHRATGQHIELVKDKASL
jgi:hypothetical protein